MWFWASIGVASALLILALPWRLHCRFQTLPSRPFLLHLAISLFARVIHFQIIQRGLRQNLIELRLFGVRVSPHFDFTKREAKPSGPPPDDRSRPPLRKGFFWTNRSVIVSQAGRVLRGFHVEALNGWLEFGGEDPAFTGQVWGALCTVRGGLGVWHDVRIEPNFMEPCLAGDVHGRLTLFPLEILARIVIAFGVLAKPYWVFRREIAKGVHNDRTDAAYPFGGTAKN